MKKYLYKLHFVLILAAAAAILGACTAASEREQISPLEAQREEFINAVNARLTEETEGVQVNQIRELNGNTLIAVDYPSYAPNEQISFKVYEYIMSRVDEFKEEAQSMGEPTEQTGLYTLSITYKPYETTDGIIGFKFTENMFSGKTKLNNYISTMNFEKASGQGVEISRFFNPSTSYLNTIADTVRAYINRTYDFGDSKDEELFKEGTAPNLQNYSNFVEAPGHKFIFYFNEGQIAPAEMGMIQAVIPMAEFKNILNAELKEIYNPTPLPNSAASGEPSVSAEPSVSYFAEPNEEPSFAPLESITPQ